MVGIRSDIMHQPAGTGILATCSRGGSSPGFYRMVVNRQSLIAPKSIGGQVPRVLRCGFVICHVFNVRWGYLEILRFFGWVVLLYSNRLHLNSVLFTRFSNVAARNLSIFL